MSLTTIVTAACSELGVPVPSPIFGGTTTDAAKWLGLANREGKELSKRYTWQRITKEETFISLAQESQTGAIPTDLDRFVNETFFNRTRKRQVMGPLTSQEWQVRKATTASVVYDTFRVRGNEILLMPTPVAGETYAYEYVSKNWLTNAAGDTEREEWGADSDVALLDENLIVLGLKWRWQESMGLDYAETFRTYEMQVSQAMARDGSKRTLSFTGDRTWDKPRYPGVIEGSWNIS